MNAAIKNPSHNEIDAAFKNLNISSKDKNKNESITSDELFLFKPKILQAIEYIREKRKRPDTNAIYEHLKKTEASNIDKETIGNIISELINQKILENKKIAYGDSFRLIADKEKDTLDEIKSPYNIDNIDKNDNLSDPGININCQPFTYRNEKDMTQEISPIKESVINLDVHNPLTQPIRETKPVINLDQQQIMNRFKAQISALKSHLKCKVSTMNSRIDLLSEVRENKVNVLNDQCKNFEMLQDNIKFFQMELKIQNEIINNLLDMQSAIVESLSLAKQQNSEPASLAKQQSKAQDKLELHRTKLAQSSKESLQQHQQNKHHQKNLYDVDKHLQKQKYHSSHQLKQNCKKLHVRNLNPNVTEENIKEIFRLKYMEYCSVEMSTDRNTGLHF